MKNLEKFIIQWEKSAKRNFSTAEDLYKTKHRDASLFFCHLALEKLLKGLVMKKIKESPPYIHDLAKLAQLAQLELSSEQLKDLRTISTFNIAARYDDEKLAFHEDQ